MAISNNIISSLGAGSGIDTKNLVEQLVEIEKAPKQERIDTKKETYETQISDFGLLRSALAVLQDSADLLKDPLNFSAKNASFTDSSSISPTKLDDTAPPGDYTFEVLGIARAQSLSTAATFADPTDAVGKGVLTFSFGEWDSNVPPEAFTVDTSRDSFNVTIDDTNNSLIGLRDAINAADQGVQASIVSDAGVYKLVITAPSGATNELQITVAEDGASPTNTDPNDLSRFAFAPGVAGANQQLQQNQAGKDASLVVNGLAVSRSSNTITDVIEGFEFSIIKEAPGEVMSVNIFEDKGLAEETVRGFVDAFNAFLEAVEPIIGYNEEEEKDGSLKRDATAKGIINGLRNEIAAAVPGLSEGFTSLAAVGIRTELDGTISIDEDTFNAAFSDNYELIKALFAPQTSSSDTKVSVNGFGAQTVPGSYDVVITQQPDQGELIGVAAAGTLLADLNAALPGYLTGAAPAVSLLTDMAGTAGSVSGGATGAGLVANLAASLPASGDFDFSLTVDGVASGTISLVTGTDYVDEAGLAAHIQAMINADITLAGAGKSVSVSHNGTGFVITSDSLGGSSSVSAISNLGGLTSQLLLDAGSAALTPGTQPAADAYDFTIDIDGVTTGIISLTSGVSYSNATLAAHIQSQINLDPANDVTVTHDGSAFVITSNSSGASSSVSNFVALGANAADLGLDLGVPTAGSDTARANDYDFSIKVNGVTSGTISLTPGLYADHDQLAAHIQSQINDDAKLKANGADVDVIWNTDHFEITSRDYGSKSNVVVTALGASAADLGLAGGTSTAGTDVKGTWNGVEGFGLGNVLLAKVGTDPYGLTLVVQPGASSATVNFSGGFGRELSSLIDQYLQSNGLIATREDNLNDNLESLEGDQEKLDRRIDAYQARLQNQFLMMERIISGLNSNGGFLDGILDRLPFTAQQK